MNKQMTPHRALSALLPLGLIAILAAQCTSNGPAQTSDTPDGIHENDTSRRAGDRDGQVTPAEERRNTATEMRALRATLVTELEEVRSRLNKGTASHPEHEADQVRASELAQGLERIDRALVAMDTTTDATWATVREHQLNEVQDVRDWMNEYDKDAASSRQ